MLLNIPSTGSLVKTSLGSLSVSSMDILGAKEPTEHDSKVENKKHLKDNSRMKTVTD